MIFLPSQCRMHPQLDPVGNFGGGDCPNIQMMSKQQLYCGYVDNQRRVDHISTVWLRLISNVFQPLTPHLSPLTLLTFFNPSPLTPHPSRLSIAEGAARNSRKEYIQFLYIALGSIAELETQLLIAQRLGFLQDSLENTISDLKQPLIGLIKALKESHQS